MDYKERFLEIFRREVTREGSDKLLDWLEAYVSGGGSLIWCSHLPDELSRLCGAVLTLENGNLVT